MSVHLSPNPTESPCLCQIKTAQSPRKQKKTRRTVWPFSARTDHYGFGFVAGHSRQVQAGSPSKFSVFVKQVATRRIYHKGHRRLNLLLEDNILRQLYSLLDLSVEGIGHICRPLYNFLDVQSNQVFNSPDQMRITILNHSLQIPYNIVLGPLPLS